MKSAPKNFKLPKKVEFSVEKTPNYGLFIAEPFEKGFAVTIGNSLRRVLMSSIQGAAISSIRIDGIDHEFSSIPGVLEDLVQIILNLKKIRIKYASYSDKEDSKFIQVRLKGPCYFRAGDLSVDSSIEIMNPDLYIATLNEDADVNMDIEVKTGFGYVSSEEKESGLVGVIPIDSIFSPIEKVVYSVSETRLGQKSDYEKLTLEVWTDGSLFPEDAVSYASKILMEHISLFNNFEEDDSMDTEEEFDEKEQKLKIALMKHVEELDFSVRTLHVLKSLDIDFISQIVKKTEIDISKSKYYSEHCLDELKSKLSVLGLSFMDRNF